MLKRFASRFLASRVGGDLDVGLYIQKKNPAMSW
jgi:hypothetical protein